MSTSRFLPLFLAAAALPALAQQPAPPTPAQPHPAPKAAARPAPQPRGLGLKDGDRYIFIGDSITHQCLYTQDVENFYYTRYPEKHIHFRNAGVSGDRAQDALNRWDEDIAAFQPTVATILLGMNDGSYRDFDAQVFQTYAKGMTELMDKLDSIHCRVIVMSPTMFDHEAYEKKVAEHPERANKNPENYNAVLAYYGKWLQEQARHRGYQFVDLFGPLNDLTVEERKQDPAFTLIPDAIHPQADGHLVMAYSLLHETNELGAILGTGVRLVNGQWKSLAPALVKDISGEPGKSVSYTVKQTALPWAEFEAAPIGTKLTRSGHTGSQESHVVVGLQSGRYDLIINGQTVGVFDEKMLGVHAEIEQAKESPTYQQAMKVIALNRERNDKAVRPLRDLWSKQKGALRKKAEPGGQEAYDKWQEEFKAKRAELEKLADEYEAKIYEANQVPVIKVEVRPTTQPEPAKPQTAAAGAVKKAA